MGFSDDEVLEFLASLLTDAHCINPDVELSHLLTRDISDTKFLALAQASAADYLVTNDRRHLLPLFRFEQTSIVLPSQFLQEVLPT